MRASTASSGRRRAALSWFDILWSGSYPTTKRERPRPQGWGCLQLGGLVQKYKVYSGIDSCTYSYIDMMQKDGTYFNMVSNTAFFYFFFFKAAIQYFGDHFQKRRDRPAALNDWKPP